MISVTAFIIIQSVCMHLLGLPYNSEVKIMVLVLEMQLT